MIDPQDLAARGQLDLAQLDDLGWVVARLTRLHATRAVAAASVGAGDENRRDAFGGRLRQHAAGAGRLIVGMGVHSHESQGSIRHVINTRSDH